MSSSSPPKTIEHLKTQARRLRQALAERGEPISHSRALELLAVQHGYRDWNTLCAVSSRQNHLELALDSAVEGEYLGQPFTGHVIGIQTVKGKGSYLTLQFDKPVDVVTFDSFSALRHRVRKFVDLTGTSPEKTSNGKPHLRVRAMS